VRWCVLVALFSERDFGWLMFCDTQLRLLQASTSLNESGDLFLSLASSTDRGIGQEVYFVVLHHPSEVEGDREVDVWEHTYSDAAS
jgi:hypothetical protein